MIDRGLLLMMLVIFVVVLVIMVIGHVSFGWSWIVVFGVAVAAGVLSPLILAALFYVAWMASGSH